MVLILGGGLAGLSTAYHLGDTPHLVLEAEPTPGGLCRSREVDGFVFDYTGHLLHLRDERITALVDELLPDAFEVVERRARIRTRGVSLPFPFQGNLHGLPREVVAQCLLGFVDSKINNHNGAISRGLTSVRLALSPDAKEVYLLIGAAALLF